MEKLSVKKPDIQQVWQAGGFLLCVLLALRITSGLDGTEFSEGGLTGPLLSMEEIGAAFFIVAVVLTFVFPRVAAVIGLASSVLCLPLYLFFIAPVPFAQIFEFKVQAAPGFHWHAWPVTGVPVLAVTLYVCIRRLVGTSRKRTPQRA